MMPEKYKQLYRNTIDYPQIQANILKKCFDYLHLADLNGDYLEFGVWKGDTFSIAYHFAQVPNMKYLQTNRLRNMQFYAFDSFCGLPELTKKDKQGFHQSDFVKGSYACDRKTFVKNLIDEDVNLNKVHIVEGWFKDTLKSKLKRKLYLRKASIVWIDCDLYSSTTYDLDFITSYLVDGSIILFDDWYTYRGNPNKGEQKAFREWLRRNPQFSALQFHKFGWHGNSFLIHRDARK